MFSSACRVDPRRPIPRTGRASSLRARGEPRGSCDRRRAGAMAPELQSSRANAPGRGRPGIELERPGAAPSRVRRRRHVLERIGLAVARAELRHGVVQRSDPVERCHDVDAFGAQILLVDPIGRRARGNSNVLRRKRIVDRHPVVREDHVRLAQRRLLEQIHVRPVLRTACANAERGLVAGNRARRPGIRARDEGLLSSRRQGIMPP